MPTWVRFSAWYREFFDDFGLTLGGRIAFSLVALLGVAGFVGDLGMGGEHGDQLAAVLLIFTWLGLAAVIGADAAFRLLRKFALHFAGRNGRTS